jgi:aminoglycoside 6'-N-acetyltransferase I
MTGKVRRATVVDASRIAEMCFLLWPDATVDEHRIDVESALLSGMYGTMPAVTFVAEDDGGVIGFVQVALRSHADGCDMGQAVAFLEGWFVEERARRNGVGGALVAAAEAWARESGCREMASDTWIDHELSQRAHAALGFEVVDRCVHFRKSL